MSELLTIVLEQGKKIEQMQKSLHDLSVLVMKNKVNDTWLDEDVAAEMVGYHPQNFRRKVKTGNKEHKEPWCIISYRNTNGRNWQYSRKSLIQFQQKTSIEQ